MSTYLPIQAITLSSAASSVEFTGIPQIYTDLVIVCQGRMASGGAINNLIRFNNDTGSNYSRTFMFGDGSLAQSGRNSNQTNLGFPYWDSTNPNITIININNYSNTTTNKTAISSNNQPASTVTAEVGLWRSTAAITSISITRGSTNDFASGSTFTLYGIGTGAPKAFGGDEVRTDGTYWYHIFLSSGAFESVQSLNDVDYLVVAGGGGGGGNRGSGGGGGGYRCSVTGELSGANSSPESKLSIIGNTRYVVTVGAGGAAGTSNGTNGSDSVFGSIVSKGGGAGVDANLNGITGGSGSGGGGSDAIALGGSGPGLGGSPTQFQGFSGGNGFMQNGRAGAAGGGGGAGGAGVTPNGSNAPNGGPGINSSITGTSTARAGGGGGGKDGRGYAGNGGAGGSGGGGTASNTGATGGGGTVNTGGGGAGGGVTASPLAGNPGGAGGSGIVIVRYPA